MEKLVCNYQNNHIAITQPEGKITPCCHFNNNPNPHWDDVNLNTYESIGVITNSLKPSISDIDELIYEITNLFNRKSYKKEDIIKIMNKLLPNFSHIETGKSLDQKM